MPTRWLNRRLIVRATIFLLLGAIINVAVAWGCAYPREGAFSAGPCDPTEGDLQWWSRHTPEEWKDKFGFAGVVIGPGFCLRDLASDPALEGPSLQHFRVETGLPVKSMAGEAWISTTYVDASGNYKEHSEFDLHGLRWNRSGSDDEEGPSWMLPLRPIWWGFLLNSVSWGTALWLCVLLPAAPRRIRTWRRLKHGHCPNCNYDLRATTTGTCPECGNQVTAPPEPPRA